MRKLFTILVTILLTTNVFAQAPGKMSYQAVVRDAGNALVTNQMVGTQISILEGSSSGNAIYVETQTPTSNTNGLLSLEIGTGTVVSGDFTSIDWTNGPYFIKTETDPTGGTDYTITGTSQLMSVPYALHAKTAQSIAGGITETDPVFGISIASGITTLDTANWNNHTIDTDTQLDSLGITALGFTNGTHTIDTQIDSTGISNLGFVAGAITTEVDGSISNELQVLSLSNDTICLSNGGFVTLPVQALNLDNDSTNEYLDSLYLSGDNLIVSQSNGTNIDTTNLSSINYWNNTGDDIYYKQGNVGFGTGSPIYNLHVQDSLVGKGIYAVANSSNSNIGIEGIANSSSANNNTMYGVMGTAQGIGGTGTGAHYGLYGRAYGGGSTNVGTYGYAQGGSSNSGSTNRGVEGEVASTTAFWNQGVFGVTNAIITGAGYNAGVTGSVSGHSSTNYGVLTMSTGTGTANYGGAFFSYGGAAGAKKNYGVYGFAWGMDTNIGVWANAPGGTPNDIGIYSQATGLAGYFIGNVAISGNLSITGSISKGSGTFKIDHPQDPDNKYLVHSFVESPEMLNVYNGNIITDTNGLAIVKMPDYFDSNNKDYRYQLTAIGQFAQCIVKQEMENNSFIIQTNIPNIKVSWQVTGVRNDPYANENRIVPEVDKADNEKGLYLHPELYGQDKSKAIFKPIGNGHTKEQLEMLKKSSKASSQKEIDKK